MGLGGLMEVWSKYGIQILVLLSLGLQLLLFILPILRRHKMLEKWKYPARLFKLLLWLAYQLADTTAIYVLGHMAISSSSSSLSGEVMALWASFLLTHLGGQDTMTAHSLEDNRLWKRHLLTLLVQAAGVLYVLPGHEGGGRSSGSYPNRLRVAAAFVFVVGFFKFVERIWVLRSSDMNKLFNRKKLWDNFLNWQGPEHYTAPPGQDSSELAEEDLKQAHVLLSFCKFQFVNSEKRCMPMTTYHMDVIEYYAREKRLFGLVHLQLSLMHDLLYTKAAAIHTWCGFLLRVFSWLATATTCMLVFLSGSIYGGRRLDAAVTYTLLVGAFLLETVSSLKATGSTWTRQMLRSRGWDGLGRVVLGFRRLFRAAEQSRRRHTSYIGGQSSTGICGDHVWWSAFGGEIPDTSLVEDQLVEMVTKYMETGQKMKLVDSRGGLSLDLLLLSSGDEGNATLIQELEQLEFDEYLELWYHATREFHDSLLDSAIKHNYFSILRLDLLCGVSGLSKYMMYLFNKQPHMLPLPVRQNEDYSYHLRRSLEKELLVGGQQESNEKLKHLLWVWIEMLCYAASHCNPESHARELSNGSPEFVTVLWLVKAYLINVNTQRAIHNIIVSRGPNAILYHGVQYPDEGATPDA